MESKKKISESYINQILYYTENMILVFYIQPSFPIFYFAERKCDFLCSHNPYNTSAAHMVDYIY